MDKVFFILYLKWFIHNKKIYSRPEPELKHLYMNKLKNFKYKNKIGINREIKEKKIRKK